MYETCLSFIIVQQNDYFNGDFVTKAAKALQK